MRSVKAVVGGLVVLVAAVGCDGGRGPARSSGSLAVSNDSQYLYAADSDNGSLIVLDAKSLNKVAEVKVGERPFRVSVAKDDAIFVANRGSRTVSVIARGDWSVRAELATGVDPVGMQVSNDGKTLYVVSATANDTSEYGILQAFDTTTLAEQWNLPVGDEPRGLAIINDERALISHYKTGEVSQVDLKKASVIDANIDVYTAVNRSELTTVSQTNVRGSSPLTFHPRAMTDLAATPDGSRVFATSMLAREAPILTNPTPATPYYAAQGPRLAGSVATPALFTFDTTSAVVNPLLDDVSGQMTGFGGYYGQPATEPTFPQTSFSVSGANYGGTTPNPVLQGPSVAVVDMTGEWLFMVNRESMNVSVVSTNKRTANPTSNANGNPYGYFYNELPSVHSTASIGKGADGIAVLGDNTTAYVYNQFDHSVQRLTMRGGSLSSDKAVAVADPVLSPEQIAGRNMFFDANDRTISAVTASVACSSCHLEGRDDGHTWQFPDGPRQTPTLAGRGMKDTGPYHWSGEFNTMQAFLEHTIISRMGGTGLKGPAPANLDAFVDAMPAPENPYKHAQLTEQQSRGALAFSKAQCGTCHSGAWLTNNVKGVNVGTLDTNRLNPDTVAGLNVPSLRGLARSAPYLHTGAALTLKERIMSNKGDQHGKTSLLSPEEMDDLVAYLRSL